MLIFAMQKEIIISTIGQGPDEKPSGDDLNYWIHDLDKSFYFDYCLDDIDDP
jgi:hypothetical protein